MSKVDFGWSLTWNLTMVAALFSIVCYFLALGEILADIDTWPLPLFGIQNHWAEEACMLFVTQDHGFMFSFGEPITFTPVAKHLAVKF